MTPLFTLRNLLVVTAAALAAALGFETDWGNAFTAPPAPVRPVSGKHDSAAVLPEFRLSPDTTNYSQISDRPLLNPTRRPAPTQVVVAATEPPKPQIRRGLYQLVGVTDLGNTKIAQVREVSTNRVKSVREGEPLQELMVNKIGNATLTLTFQGETDVLELAKFTNSGRVPQPPQPIAPTPVAANFSAPVPTAASPLAAAPVAAVDQPSGDVARLLEMRRAARAAAAGPATDPNVEAAATEERRRAFMAARSGRPTQ